MKRLTILVLAVTLLICVSGCSRIRIPKDERAVLTFHILPEADGTEPIVETLTAEESALVRQILMGAKHNPGIGGCAYTEGVSFTFGDQVYAVAYDGCHTIWDIQNEKYYVVDEAEWDYIVSLFARYGGRL